MYSLAALLGIVSMYFLFSALRPSREGLHTGKWLWWALYAVASIAALYTLYLNTLTIVAQNVLAVLIVLLPLVGRVWIRFRERQRSSRRTAASDPKSPQGVGGEFGLSWLAKWALVQAVILVAYAPWLYLMLRHSAERPASDVPTLEFGVFWQVYTSVMALGVDINIGDYLRLLPLPLLLVALGIAGAVWDRRRRHLGLLLLLYLTIAPVLIYLLSLPTSVFYTPFVHARYFLYLLPAFVLALSWGLAILGRRMAPLGVAILAIVAGISLLLTTGYYADRFLDDDYKAMAATIEAYADPSDAIVLYPDTDWPIFLYHYKGDLSWYPVPYAAAITPEWAEESLGPVLQEHRAIWLVSSIKALDNDPQRHVLTWLTNNAQPVVDQKYLETRVTLFASPQARPNRETRQVKTAPMRSLSETLPDGISLVGFDQWLSRAAAGEITHLAIYWQDPGTKGYDYSIALVDSNQVVLTTQVIRRSRTGATRPMTRQQLTLVVPASAHSGTFQWQLRATDRSTKALVRTVDLGKLEVVQGKQRWPQTATEEQNISIQHPREVLFGEDAQLLGYDLAPSPDEKIKPGDVVNVTLYWRRLQQISTSYTVFVHLLGDQINAQRNNAIWGQQDAIPVNGQAPTTAWRENETIIDRYEVPLDRNAPPGHYLIEIGLYQRATGERLNVFEDGQKIGDRAIIGEFDVD